MSAHPSASAATMHQRGGPPPGLATAVQVSEEKRDAKAITDRLFVTLLIAHHTGALALADAVLARSRHTAAFSLARGILSDHHSEIDGLTEPPG